MAIAPLALMVGVAAHAEDQARELSERFTKPITFRFVNEDGSPIDGTFTLHHTKNGDYVDNWHRSEPLNQQGEITINEFPPEFEFGVSSGDEFYEHWQSSSDLNPEKTSYVFRCNPSGGMRFEITMIPSNHYSSLVVEYHRRMADGSHKLVKGIGVFPYNSEWHVNGGKPGKYIIGGLDSGEYYIAIKFDYEDEKPIYKSESFSVKLKEYAALQKIVITEDMIKASRR